VRFCVEGKLSKKEGGKQNANAKKRSKKAENGSKKGNIPKQNQREYSLSTHAKGIFPFVL
jgi:hypothetical protein